MNEGKQNPTPPVILEERDRTIIRVGNTEIVQTKDSITAIFLGGDLCTTPAKK